MDFGCVTLVIVTVDGDACEAVYTFCIGLTRGYNSCSMNCRRTLKRRAMRSSVSGFHTIILQLPFLLGCLHLPFPCLNKSVPALVFELSFSFPLSMASISMGSP